MLQLICILTCMCFFACRCNPVNMTSMVIFAGVYLCVLVVMFADDIFL